MKYHIRVLKMFALALLVIDVSDTLVRKAIVVWTGVAKLL